MSDESIELTETELTENEITSCLTQCKKKYDLSNTEAIGVLTSMLFGLLIFDQNVIERCGSDGD